MSRVAIFLALAALALAAPASASAAAPAKRFCTTTDSGWNIYANRVTTCQFGRATAKSVRRYQREAGGIDYGARFTTTAWSSALANFVVIHCRVGWTAPARVSCTGGTGARVTLRFVGKGYAE